MDTVKFIKEMGRMCDSNRRDNCDECPFTVNKDTCFMGSMWHDPGKAVEMVEKWSNEYPQKTYKDDFLEEFPNAKCFDDGIPMVHWCDVYNKGNCKYGQGDGFRMCVECWSEPME